MSFASGGTQSLKSSEAWSEWVWSDQEKRYYKWRETQKGQYDYEWAPESRQDRKDEDLDYVTRQLKKANTVEDAEGQIVFLDPELESWSGTIGTPDQDEKGKGAAPEFEEDWEDEESSPKSFNDSEDRPRATTSTPSFVLKPDIQGPVGEVEIDPRFRVQPSNSFVPGKILNILWFALSGNRGGPLSISGTLEIRNQWGTSYVGFLQFIIIENHEGFCTAAPISTYGGLGCKKRGVKAKKHGIIHEKGHTSRSLPDEPRLGFPPVRMEMESQGEKLARESRVKYSELVTIGYNVKVFFIGFVVPEDWELVMDAVRKCWEDKIHHKRKLGKLLQRSEAHTANPTVDNAEPKANADEQEGLTTHSQVQTETADFSLPEHNGMPISQFLESQAQPYDGAPPAGSSIILRNGSVDFGSNLPGSVSIRALRKRKLNTDDDGSGEERNRSENAADALSGSENRRRLACPFCKKDPVRYFSCFSARLRTISSVKMHLVRRHSQPIYCTRCMTIVGTSDGLLEHLRNESCQRTEYVPPEGVTPEQKREWRKPGERNKTEEEKWYHIYRMLFPAQLKPLTPYLNGDLSEEVSKVMGAGKKDQMLHDRPRSFENQVNGSRIDSEGSNNIAAAESPESGPHPNTPLEDILVDDLGYKTSIEELERHGASQKSPTASEYHETSSTASSAQSQTTELPKWEATVDADTHEEDAEFSDFETAPSIGYSSRPGYAESVVSTSPTEYDNLPQVSHAEIMTMRELFTQILVEDNELLPLFRFALEETDIGGERLERNLRRLLVVYSKEMVDLAADKVCRTAAIFVGKHANFISKTVHRIFDTTKMSDETKDTTESHRMVEHYLRRIQDNEPLALEDDVFSDSDDEPASFEDTERVKQFLRTGAPWKKLRESLRSFVTPQQPMVKRNPVKPTFTYQSLPILIERIFHYLPLRQSEPRIPAGKVRARWTCECGARLYDDYAEIEPGSVRQLEQELQQLHGTQDDIGQRMLSGTEIAASAGKIISRILQAFGTIFSIREPTLPTSSDTQQPHLTELSNVAQSSKSGMDLVYLLSCIDKGYSGTPPYQ